MQDRSGGFVEWLIPFAFVICAGWAVWHTPAYILDFIPPENESLLDQMSELHKRKDVTPALAGLFGGYADPLDWAALILIPILFVLGMRCVQCAHGISALASDRPCCVVFRSDHHDINHLDDSGDALRSVFALCI